MEMSPLEAPAKTFQRLPALRIKTNSSTFLPKTSVICPLFLFSLASHRSPIPSHLLLLHWTATEPLQFPQLTMLFASWFFAGGVPSTQNLSSFSLCPNHSGLSCRSQLLSHFLQEAIGRVTWCSWSKLLLIMPLSLWIVMACICSEHWASWYKADAL